MKNISQIFATLVVGGMLLSGLASAQDADPSFTVNYKDLDLGSNRGLASLSRRLHFAAETVCQDTANSVDATARGLHQQCVQTAEDGAIRRINVATLTAYYQTKTGRTIHSASISFRNSVASSEE